jgi:hypothetical protein
MAYFQKYADFQRLSRLAKNGLILKISLLINNLVEIILIPISVSLDFQDWRTFESKPFF